MARGMVLVLLVLLGGAVDAGAAPSSDFNGDGIDDLAVGVPGESVGGVSDAGAVNVLYGSPDGLTAAGNQFWHQNRVQAGVAIRGVSETPDNFGYALAAGDFNCDGVADLAVGAFRESVDGILIVGAVNVLYGTGGVFDGLTAAGNQFWNQNSVQGGVPILGAAEQLDFFGTSLAAGDFNGDGCADLAVGVPGESVEGVTDAGAVNVLYGSPEGLTAAGNQLWHQNSVQGGVAIEGVVEGSDNFGQALVAGDFNCDGVADLAVGVRDESVDGVFRAGAVNVLYGAARIGLTAEGNQFWNQNSVQGGVPILGAAEQLDFFGTSLAAGDFNGDGCADLAVGVPGESVQGIEDAGAVNVLYGSAEGLTAAGNQFWAQNSVQGGVAIEGVIENFDNFGIALAAGDFNCDGVADLAVGVTEGVDGASNAGAVNVLYGVARIGLTAAGNQLWHQNSAQGGVAIEGVVEPGDVFGSSLAAGDFNGDGCADLAVGVPGESVGGLARAGAVNVLYGSPKGLTAAGNQLWTQNSAPPGGAAIDGVSEVDDRFGHALAGR